MTQRSGADRASIANACAKVLVVDDDEGIRFGLRRFLTSRGFAVEHADSWSGVRAQYEAFQPDAIVMDHVLGDGEGVALLTELRSFAPTVPVVILTGHGSIGLAVQAMRGGAEHFLTRPVELSTLEEVLRKAVTPIEGATAADRRQGSGRRRIVLPDPFAGASDTIKRLREQAERMLDSDRPILVLGETGTGKSLIARWIHANGNRAAAPFVDLNCAALSRDLLESELFGHERGAFTGAQTTKVGLLEAADQGTLFLDEIGDMDLAIQPKLLKALEDKKFRRLGDVRDRGVDLRMVSATHQDLGVSVRNRSFRADLYYRISALRLTVPALRQRREDVPILVRGLLTRLCADLHRPVVELTRAAEASLVAHDWPGNVRELKNVLDRALCGVSKGPIDVADLAFDHFESDAPPEGDASGYPSGTMTTLKEAEVQLIERVLREEGGRVEATARRLGVPRSSLYHKLKALGLKPVKG